MGRLITKSVFLLSLFSVLSACKTAEPPVVSAAPTPLRVYAPKPAPAPLPAPEPESEPVYAEPDQRWLPGHSSYTTPVPVEPVEVDELGPVIPE